MRHDKERQRILEVMFNLSAQAYAQGVGMNTSKYDDTVTCVDYLTANRVSLRHGILPGKAHRYLRTETAKSPQSLDSPGNSFEITSTNPDSRKYITTLEHKSLRSILGRRGWYNMVLTGTITPDYRLGPFLQDAETWSVLHKIASDNYGLSLPVADHKALRVLSSGMISSNPNIMRASVSDAIGTRGILGEFSIYDQSGTESIVLGVHSKNSDGNPTIANITYRESPVHNTTVPSISFTHEGNQVILYTPHKKAVHATSVNPRTGDTRPIQGVYDLTYLVNAAKYVSRRGSIGQVIDTTGSLTNLTIQAAEHPPNLQEDLGTFVDRHSLA